MAADADGEKTVQARLLSAFAAAVAQNFVTADNEDVRNQLLVAFVEFGFATIDIKDVFGRGDDREIFFDSQTNPLKNPELLEEFSFKTKHTFFCRHSLPFLLKQFQSLYL